MKEIKMFFMIVSLLTMMSGTTYAALVADDVGDELPAPAKTTALLFYYDYISGTDKYSGGTLSNRDTNLTGHIGVFRAIHFNQIGKFPVAVAMALPYGNLSINGSGVGGGSYSSSEIGDITLIAGFWPIAMPEKTMWMSVSGWLTAPTGQYNPDKPLSLNLGQNMWSGKLQVGFVKMFGPLSFDVNGFAQIFSNNGRYVQPYVPNGSATLKRDIAYNVDAHLKFSFTRELFLSADYYYQWGGETKTDQFGSNEDTLNDHIAGLTLGYMINKNLQFLVKGRDTFKTKNGIETKDLGIRLAYFF